MRLIDADALKRELDKAPHDNTIARYVFYVLSSMLDNATIEVEPENVNSYQTAYKNGEYDTLDLLAGAWHGKQYYFKQRNGMIYSRETCQYMTLDDAIAEFANKLGDDGSI